MSCKSGNALKLCECSKPSKFSREMLAHVQEYSKSQYLKHKNNWGEMPINSRMVCCQMATIPTLVYVSETIPRFFPTYSSFCVGFCQ